MGLLIGIGNTKPTFAYDYYYGIEWDCTVSTPTPTRVGKAELHQSVPIQAGMCRCLLNDDGTVNYYLNANDSTKRDTGAAADLTGADGQYMTELPEAYMRFETDGNTNRCLMSQYALPGFTLWKKDYVSAVEATVDRTNLILAAVVNTDAQYRGGNNTSSRDDTYRSQLGRPATSISLTNFRTYARKRGTTEWNCSLYQTHKKLWWFFAVEYCTFNSQLAFNAALDGNGYHQGGLGNGVTTLNSTLWSSFNGSYPFVPCGYTNELGNATGYVEYTMPFEYNAGGEDYYAGEYDEETAYTSGQYVSSGESLYSCKADAPAGTALTDTDYFTAVTRTVVQVTSYRGVENCFGHIWEWTDGCKCLIQSEDDGGVSEFYVADNPDDFNSSGTDGYVKRGELPRSNGYVTAIMLGEYGDIMPVSIGGGSTTYFCDYFYTSIPDSGTAERGVLFGGRANDGAHAGLVYAATANAPSFTDATVGSRLCFYPKS